MYSCLLKGVISDYLLIRNSSKKWPIYLGYSLYFWPFNKSEEKMKVIFVISVIMPWIWNVFIKFRWHDEKLTGVDNQKVGVDNEKVIELDIRIFFSNFSLISIKKYHPKMEQNILLYSGIDDHASYSDLNSIFCCLKMKSVS